MATIDFFVNTDNSVHGNGLTRADTGNYWAVSIDTLSNEPTVGDTLTNGTNSRVLAKIILNAATWASATQAILILTGTDPSWSDGNNITNTTQASEAVGDVDDTADGSFWSDTNSDAGAYKTISAAEAGINGYGDIGSDDIKIHCSGTAADTDVPVYFNGWTAPNSLTIGADDGTANGVASYGNDGFNTGVAYSASHYRVESSGVSKPLHIAQTMATHLDGLQIKNTGSSNEAINHSGASPGTVKRCRIEHGGSGTGGALAYGALAEISNCVINGTNGTGASAVGLDNWGSVTSVVNNAIYGFNNASGVGLKFQGAFTITNLRNNVFYDNTTDLSLGSGTITNKSTNAADADIDTDTSTLHPTWTAGVHFVDAPNGDFRPTTSSSSTGAPFMNGTATNLPATDIVGNARGSGGSPDVGPFHIKDPIVYVNTDNPGDTDGRDDGNGKASLSSVESTYQGDITEATGSARTTFTTRCSGTTLADTTNVVWSGWTTDTTHAITIEGNSAVGDGVWSGIGGLDTTVYRLDTAAGAPLFIGDDNITVKRIQVQGSGTNDGSIDISDASNIVVEQCLIENDAGTAQGALRIRGSTTSGVAIRNCLIISNPTAATVDPVYQQAGGTVDEVINCAFVNKTNAGRMVRLSNCTLTDFYNNIFYADGASSHLFTTFSMASSSQPNYGGNWGDTDNNRLDFGHVTDPDNELLKYCVDPANYDFTPIYSSAANAIYANATRTRSGGFTVPVTDATGTSRGDPTNVNCTPDIGPVHLASPVAYVNLDNPGDTSGRNHANGLASLSTAETAIQSDLVVNNRDIDILIGTDGTKKDDNLSVSFNGSVTGVGNAIRVAGNSAELGVNPYTDGKFSTSYVYLSFTSFSTFQAAFNLYEDYFTIEDLQIEHILNHTGGWVIESRGDAVGTFDINRCYFRLRGSGGSSGKAIRIDAGNTVSVRSCIFATEVTDIWNQALNKDSAASLSAFNCTAYGGWGGNVFQTLNAVRNCAVFENGSSTVCYSATTAMTTSAASDTTGDPASLDSLTAANEFNDPTNYDLRLKSGGSLVSNGTDAYHPSGGDITGTTFTTGRIGAFNQVVAAAGGTFVPVVRWI